MVDYPKTHQCYCGRENTLREQDVKTMWSNTWIVVKDVPTYLCEKDHAEFARVTRMQIAERLKEAYTQGLEEISYN